MIVLKNFNKSILNVGFILFLILSVVLNLYLIFNINNKSVEKEQIPSRVPANFDFKDSSELTLIKLSSEQAFIGYIKSQSFYLPILEEEGNETFQGLYKFQSSNVTYRSSYIFEFSEHEFGQRVRISKLSTPLSSKQYLIGSFVDIYDARSNIQFNVNNYISLTDSKRCDEYYSKINFDSLVNDVVEYLVLKGCMDYSNDYHSSPVEITFSNGKKVTLTENDEEWFYSIIKKCGQNCMFSKNYIE